jgi:hypothetical protein
MYGIETPSALTFSIYNAQLQCGLRTNCAETHSMYESSLCRHSSIAVITISWWCAYHHVMHTPLHTLMGLYLYTG